MLLNWPNPPPHTRTIVDQLLTALTRSQTDSYAVARIIAPLAPTDASDYRHVAFWQRLRYFCRLYLRTSHQLRLIENGGPLSTANLPHAPALARHTDHAEALWSGLRTFVTLMVIGARSIASQWESAWQR